MHFGEKCEEQRDFIQCSARILDKKINKDCFNSFHFSKYFDVTFSCSYEMENSYKEGRVVFYERLSVEKPTK